MTNSEMRTILARNGVAEETIARVTENFDIEKISMIIDAATNPDSAFEAIHAFYPELEVEKMQEQMDFIQEQLEEAMKEKAENQVLPLPESQLEMTAGGFGEWWKRNWKRALGITAIIVGTAGLLLVPALALTGILTSGLALF